MRKNSKRLQKEGDNQGNVQNEEIFNISEESSEELTDMFNAQDDDRKIIFESVEYPLTPQELEHPNYRRSASSRSIRKSKYRAVLKTGDVNTSEERKGSKRSQFLMDMFSALLALDWSWFILITVSTYLGTWSFFAVIWYLFCYIHDDLDPDLQLNAPNIQKTCMYGLKNLGSAFLFSIEVQQTVGFGSRYPTAQCFQPIFVMSVQCITGFVLDTITMGVIFSKLAQPQQRSHTIIFSNYACVGLRSGKMCLMFRVGDICAESKLIGTSIRALYFGDKLTGGSSSFYMTDLSIRADNQAPNKLFMIWPLVMVHEISPTSPLYTMTAADIYSMKFEIIVILEGITDTSGQPVQARTSYLPSEILWGYRFEPVLTFDHKNLKYLVEYIRFNAVKRRYDTPLSAEHMQKHKDASSNDNILSTPSEYKRRTTFLDPQLFY